VRQFSENISTAASSNRAQIFFTHTLQLLNSHDAFVYMHSAVVLRGRALVGTHESREIVISTQAL
jgi:hypothetical protein